MPTVRQKREIFRELYNLYFKRTLTDIQVDEFSTYVSLDRAVLSDLFKLYKESGKKNNYGYQDPPLPEMLRGYYNEIVAQRNKESLSGDRCLECSNSGEVFIQWARHIRTGYKFMINEASEEIILLQPSSFYCLCAAGRNRHNYHLSKFDENKGRRVCNWETVQSVHRKGFALNQNQLLLLIVDQWNLRNRPKNIEIRMKISRIIDKGNTF